MSRNIAAITPRAANFWSRALFFAPSKASLPTSFYNPCKGKKVGADRHVSETYWLKVTMAKAV